jgi:glycosyltransferase involved in cell wall biosynthesis
MKKVLQKEKLKSNNVLKIAILGTKGIPNNYGGFEQFAEYLSKGLAKKGHTVTVYNPHFHPYSNPEFEGVKIKKVYSPEKYMGAAANFLYDYWCLKDALNDNNDLIYEAGYHSVAPSYLLLNIKNKRAPIVITNMDGLEWKRSKWNFLTRALIKKLEKIAVKNSHYLIADNIGIQQYYKDSFAKESFFLPYGATLVEAFEHRHLSSFGLQQAGYSLAIARLEPENNLELILEGYLLSNQDHPLCIVGNFESRYGDFLVKKYRSDKIHFLGAIYNKSVLDSLRYFSAIYWHGHTVGGTNPSLLEAMACQCFIAAHNNSFNKSVLENNGLYFSSAKEVAELFNKVSILRDTHYANFAAANITKIRSTYDWSIIISTHERLFMELHSQV